MTTSKIYICTHKDFENCPTNKLYTIVDGGQLKEKYPIDVLSEETNDLTPIQPFLGEWTRMRYVWKKEELSDYIGFCHYDRYLEIDNINIEETFNEYDIITSKPMNVGAMSMQYHACHNLDDLSKAYKIAVELFPHYKDALMNNYMSNSLYTCNMFIMKKEDFIEYCEFIDKVMTRMIEDYGFSTMDDINKHIDINKEKYLKTFYPNSSVHYQARFGGFIIERLTSFFIQTKFKEDKIKTVEIKEYKHER